MSKKLAEYLAKINSAQTDWGIWVNPYNLDEFRTGQFCFDNGGYDDGFVGIGSLDSLSYGYQSAKEIIEAIAANKELVYNGSVVRFNADAMYEALIYERLDADFATALWQRIDRVAEQWAIDAAEAFVSELEERFAYPDGRYWEELRQAETEAEAWHSYQRQQLDEWE